MLCFTKHNQSFVDGERTSSSQSIEGLGAHSPAPRASIRYETRALSYNGGERNDAEDEEQHPVDLLWWKSNVPERAHVSSIRHGGDKIQLRSGRKNFGLYLALNIQAAKRPKKIGLFWSTRSNL